ncbi:MAG: hypothetical protein ACI9W2_002842 [Gammaproteobacteria bacterium]
MAIPGAQPQQWWSAGSREIADARVGSRKRTLETDPAPVAAILNERATKITAIFGERLTAMIVPKNEAAELGLTGTIEQAELGSARYNTIETKSGTRPRRANLTYGIADIAGNFIFCDYPGVFAQVCPLCTLTRNAFDGPLRCAPQDFGRSSLASVFRARLNRNDIIAGICDADCDYSHSKLYEV